MADKLKAVLAIAFPVGLAMSSQTIVNLFDSAMVGSLGEAPLAAVGQAGYLAILAIAPFMGLASAVQAYTARRVGADEGDRIAGPLLAGLWMVLGVGVFLTVAMIAVAPFIFPLLNPDPEVVAEAVPYFQARISAAIAVGMSLAFRGYWTGVSRARIFLGTQLFTHALNVIVSLALIFGYFGLPALGTLGAGIGTAVSLWAGLCVHLLLASREGRAHGVSLKVPDGDTFAQVRGQAIPAAMEQSWVYVSHTVMFWIIAQLGTAQLAAATVLMNMVAVMLVPALALGVATATMVGRSIGEGSPDKAYTWAWFVARVGIVVLGLVGLPMLLVPDGILGLFVADTATITAGHVPLQLLGAAAAVDGVATVMMFALLGAGNARTVMIWSISLQTTVLVGEYIVGPVLGLGLTAVWACNVVNRFSLALVFGTIWWRRGWMPQTTKP